MIQLPVADPGVPDTRSPVRLLVWVGRHQVPTLVAGVVFGIIWMLAQALMPFAIGRAIEDGIVEGDNSALAAWSLVLLGLGATQAIAGVMRHRNAVANWLQATFRLSQLVAHHAARSGGAIRGRLSTGEVVATVANDAMRAGGAYDITARLSGAIVSYVVTSVTRLSFFIRSYTVNLCSPPTTIPDLVRLRILFGRAHWCEDSASESRIRDDALVRPPRRLRAAVEVGAMSAFGRYTLDTRTASRERRYPCSQPMTYADTRFQADGKQSCAPISYSAG